MWDTLIDILEKFFCFFCFCFSLCFVLLTSHKAMCLAKKSASASTTAFLAFGSPLLCFTNHSIMVFHLGPSPSIIPSSLMHCGNRDQPSVLQSTGMADALSASLQVLFDRLASPEVINFIQHKSSAMNSLTSWIVESALECYFRKHNK